MKRYLKRSVSICLVVLCSLLTISTVKAQVDSLLGDFTFEEIPAKRVSATFKGTRVINGHSVQMIGKNNMEFMINHRFGAINSGAYNFFGLDQASVRLALEYGIKNNLNIGIGRSSFRKTFDGYVKYKLINQVENSNRLFTVVFFGSTALESLRPNPAIEPNYRFTDRLSYTSQLLIARKFSERFSLQLSPTYIHYNLRPSPAFSNDLFALGVSGRLKLTKRVSFNAEWFPQVSGLNPMRTNVFSLGFDIETGGHIFQLHFTNSQGMIEKSFIGETTGQWSKADIFYGFNISRSFSFNKNK